MFLVVGISAMSNAVRATPNPYNLGNASDVSERINKLRFYDISSSLKLTPLGAVLTEPVMRLLWVGQVFTHSDWIGIQAFLGLMHRINPGGKDDASNLFLYTCKGGWIDVGHILGTGLMYKIFLQTLRRGLNGLRPMTFVTLDRSDRILLGTISKELARGVQRVDPQTKKLRGYEWWAGYFAMRSSIRYEVWQNSKKKKLRSPLLASDGEATSAFTIEDLPSNYYGIMLAERIERKHSVRGFAKRFEAELMQLLGGFGVVNLDHRTRKRGCPKTVRETLTADANYYKKIAENEQVTFRKDDSTNVKSPYNYTIHPKKTLSHACLCAN
ncbi:MAG TPA: hypothetical protein VM901_09775 [Bdellovibrionota bacterium]|jgi:hypothetical protein|nr:hypothetical protein [Bdellovibrionota bacterium]